MDRGEAVSMIWEHCVGSSVMIFSDGRSAADQSVVGPVQLFFFLFHKLIQFKSIHLLLEAESAAWTAKLRVSY